MTAAMAAAATMTDAASDEEQAAALAGIEEAVSEAVSSSSPPDAESEMEYPRVEIRRVPYRIERAEDGTEHEAAGYMARLWLDDRTWLDAVPSRTRAAAASVATKIEGRIHI